MEIAPGEPNYAHKPKNEFEIKAGRRAPAGQSIARFVRYRAIPGRLAWSIAQKVRYMPSLSHDSCDTGPAGEQYRRIH